MAICMGRSCHGDKKGTLILDGKHTHSNVLIFWWRYEPRECYRSLEEVKIEREEDLSAKKERISGITFALDRRYNEFPNEGNRQGKIN
jgi:hypothetical protein